MKLSLKTPYFFIFLLFSTASLLFSCQQQDSDHLEKIEFFSDHSWGRIAFPLPDGFTASENCQLLWSDAFMIRCYESPHGQLEIIASESNIDLTKVNIFSNTIEYRLDSLGRVLPGFQLINVEHQGTEKEHILELEYFEDGTQNKGYHLEYVIARPGNQIVFRFYAPQGDEPQIAHIRQAFEAIEVFNLRK